MDPFITIHFNHGVTLAFTLQHLTRSSVAKPVQVPNSVITASVQNVLLFHSQRPDISSTIRCFRSVMSHISNWHLIHTILQKSPYLTVNRTQIRTVWRPEVWTNEFRSSSPKELDRLMCSVLPTTEINVSQGSVAAGCRLRWVYQ